MRAPLTRPRDTRVLAGVCAGLADHLSVPVAAVRVVMAGLALAAGAGALLYAWLWATVPQEGESEGIVPLRHALTKPAHASHSAPSAPAFGPSGDRGTAADETGHSQPGRGLGERAQRAPIAEIFLGLSLLAVSVPLVLMRFDVQMRLELILPAFAVCVGVGLAWWQFADRARPDRNQVPRVLGALALVAVGVLMFFVTSRQPNAWTVVAAALAVLAGVALAIAPWLLRLNRELIAERAGRARESERAEIAAHLHDSVLQTLALIQQRSVPGSDVARLARGQERELRDWLFRVGDGGGEGGSATSEQSIEKQLRDHAALLEDQHGVQCEVVIVGGGTRGGAGDDAAGPHAAAPEAIVAAAREAMLNAARHAGGTVAVYIEISPERTSVDVTDRGPGFDADNLPEGRMGVRESILGRMDRAGGTARVVPGPGGTGTSVRLTMPGAAAQSANDSDEGTDTR